MKKFDELNIKEIIKSKDKEIELLKKSNEKLKLSYEDDIYRLQYVIDTLPANVYWKNMDGINLGNNKYAVKKLKESGFNTDIIGKSDYKLFPKEAADMYRKHDVKVMQKGTEFSEEEIITLPNGNIITFLSKKVPLRNMTLDVWF